MVQEFIPQGLTIYYDQLNSYEKIKSRLEIYKNRYKTNYIKSYLVGNRKQRQWMIQASKELQLMPVTEGGADTKQDITHVLTALQVMNILYPMRIFTKMWFSFLLNQIYNTHLPSG